MKNTLTFCPYKLITGPENTQNVTVLCFSSNLQNILVNQRRERKKGRKAGRVQASKDWGFSILIVFCLQVLGSRKEGLS